MFDYLQQFNALPADLRSKVSTPEAVKEIEVLEKKFGVDLAAVVMRIMIKEIKLEALGLYLASEYSFSEIQARDLTAELKTKVFKDVAEYLGFEAPRPKVSLEDKLASVVGPAEIKSIEKIVPETTPVKVEPVKLADVKKVPVAAVSTPVKTEPVEKTLDEYSLKVDQCLDQTIKELNLSLNSEAVNRLRSILKLYLRGVKIRIDVRIALNKAENQGGLNLGDKEVSRIFKVLSKNQKEILNIKTSVKAPLGVLEKISQLDPRAAIVDDNYLATRFLDVKHELSAPKIENKKEIEAPKPVAVPSILPTAPVVPKFVAPVNPAPAAPVVLPNVDSELVSVKPVLVEKKPISIPDVQASAQSEPKTPATDIAGNKVKMEDVKKIKIMSPIDELHFLDLVNFRRLAKSPKEATAKIKEKIILLGKDDYENLVAGINAWRQSPVNKLYLSIAREAAIQGLPLKTIAESRRLARKDYLSMEEVEAVIDLNTGLMY